MGMGRVWMNAIDLFCGVIGSSYFTSTDTSEDIQRKYAIKLYPQEEEGEWESAVF